MKVTPKGAGINWVKSKWETEDQKEPKRKPVCPSRVVTESPPKFRVVNLML